MNRGILGKYADLTVVNNEGLVRDKNNTIFRSSPAELDGLYFEGDTGTGLLVPVTDGGQRYIIETLLSNSAEDSLSTLYLPHPAFSSRADLVRARKELITLIEDLKDADPGRLGVTCPVRKRPASLRELGLSMLVDLVRDITKRMMH